MKTMGSGEFANPSVWKYHMEVIVMAIEALKSAGIAAYQGSSPKPKANSVESAVKPEALPTVVKSDKAAEKVVDMAEVKPKKKRSESAVDNGRAQGKMAANEPTRTPEPVAQDNREPMEGMASTEGLKRAVEPGND